MINNHTASQPRLMRLDLNPGEFFCDGFEREDEERSGIALSNSIYTAATAAKSLVGGGLLEPLTGFGLVIQDPVFDQENSY
ncbi:hypothetical protein [Leptothoe spongobia]|uniref:Uncharacterized protein n=1 Tax=Leptothoe spongobia TAU-MAC 1115 TaxID=1967444 RepID=A0A947DF72_9CYAN|nr:hypothetical protein [Leptothoe spongobia]MBT9315923.1 hypothetical protein [Leptothoe spongobia TAU-MAC 1115]